ncbi:RdRP-domain-containing protein [Cylindrobasidium torrendii FP15055 ss-10]|uniref:RNA-dependent RNA polymerase n=1 Tax=Cylindrobasidium torrendii FP15055 ss-10 TaxID=1314674 RepID=A0A0D7BLG6_9AGAR|nr:RdRP-domain-containing protein [Cylindrobasidium torrendii FP15055 ss-10]
MAPPPRCLRDSVAKDDDTWHFTIPHELLSSNQPGHGKMVQFKTVESGAKIMFQMAKFSNNRVIQNDDINEFVLVSFSLPGRQAEWTLKDGGEYIARFLERGLFINDVQYRFYHHSASQLKERRCFLRRANTDAELDERIYQLGDFGKIMNPAKRAKRIGLLYSESQVDYILNPILKEDIHDLQYGDEVFSDGCGLMSRKLAIEVSKKKKIIFRGKRYTPSVFQIRYLGYKGVLMLHPPMDRANELSRKKLQSLREKQAASSGLTPEEETFLSAPPPPVWAQFRRSMKKFTTDKTPTFSVVGYSKPYAFGRLNNEIIVLLSSLGITAENLLLRQQEYFDWIVHASQQPEDAIDLLSAVGEYDAAERVLLDGLDAVLPVIRKCQRKEVGDFKREDGKERSRTIIKRSRKIYGVCDPFKVLKEGEVHVRITEGRGGVSTVRGCDVLVVRNPCLNPGDCLKLRAVECPALAHLVDCVVFASVARPGHHSAPSMSSGGDLDGDEYFVCWDPLLVPSVRHEAYDYPPNKERLFTSLTRQDLARHFANYNNASLGRVSNLHNRWATASPKGARCSECQELSALHSQCVDGARIKIPDRLVSPPGRPEGSEPWIIDQLKDNASRFAEKFLSESVKTQGVADSADNESHATQIILGLLQSRPVGLALSEYELFTMACRIARRQGLDPHIFFQYIDCGALTTSQKYALIAAIPTLSHEEYARLWNSFWRSDLIGPQQLYSRNIAQSFRIQRLYSSNIHGTEQFFSYLSTAFQDFTRKVLLIKTDAHFALAIFMRGQIAWDDDVDVDENLVVCSFLPHSTSEFSSYKQSPKGFRLHCGPGRLQLYDRHIANSFIYIGIQPRASGAEVVTSVALQKISKQVQLNIGRVNKKPLTEIELHVVSNRDTISHQLFDLWFEHVPTEERIRRFDRDPRPYRRFSLNDIDWNEGPPPTDSDFSTNPTSLKIGSRQCDLLSTIEPRIKSSGYLSSSYHDHSHYSALQSQKCSHFTLLWFITCSRHSQRSMDPSPNR